MLTHVFPQHGDGTMAIGQLLGGDRPVLHLLCIRLGINDVNSIYYDAQLSTFKVNFLSSFYLDTD